jgi:hypothetical protein
MFVTCTSFGGLPYKHSFDSSSRQPSPSWSVVDHAVLASSRSELVLGVGGRLLRLGRRALCLALRPLLGGAHVPAGLRGRALRTALGILPLRLGLVTSRVGSPLRVMCLLLGVALRLVVRRGGRVLSGARGAGEKCEDVADLLLGVVEVRVEDVRDAGDERLGARRDLHPADADLLEQARARRRDRILGDAAVAEVRAEACVRPDEVAGRLGRVVSVLRE